MSEVWVDLWEVSISHPKRGLDKKVMLFELNLFVSSKKVRLILVGFMFLINSVVNFVDDIKLSPHSLGSPIL